VKPKFIFIRVKSLDSIDSLKTVYNLRSRGEVVYFLVSYFWRVSDCLSPDLFLTTQDFVEMAIKKIRESQELSPILIRVDDTGSGYVKPKTLDFFKRELGLHSRGEVVDYLLIYYLWGNNDIDVNDEPTIRDILDDIEIYRWRRS